MLKTLTKRMLGIQCYSTSNTVSRIGFAGLGQMGLPMALNLIRNDQKVKLYDRQIEASNIQSSIMNDKLQNKDQKICNKLDELIYDIDYLITMLPDGTFSKQIQVENEILSKMDTNVILLDCTTTHPDESVYINNFAKTKGFSQLDSPVSGGIGGAKAGTLAFLVGGDIDKQNKSKHLYDAMGRVSIQLGNSGFGATAKLCNNLLLATTMIATCESLALGLKAGVDPTKLSEVLKVCSGRSWSVDSQNPVPGIQGEAFPPGNKKNPYSGGFKSKLMLKDVTLAMEMGKEKGMNFYLSELSRKMYKNVEELGLEDKDFTVIWSLLTDQKLDNLKYYD